MYKIYNHSYYSKTINIKLNTKTNKIKLNANILIMRNFNVLKDLYIYMLLSHFSCVRRCVTP